MTEYEKRELNAERLDCLRSGAGKSKVYFDIEKFKTDQHPAAIHAREWGKMKPYYIIQKERALAKN